MNNANQHPPTLRYFDSHIEMLAFFTRQIDDQNGVAIEFGVYSGTTLEVIRQGFSGPVYGFDSFKGLPEDWRDGFPQGFFETSEVPTIENVTLVVGTFQETLEPFLEKLIEPIAFIHFDADLYSSTIFCLDKVTNFLAPESIFVFDEYHNYEGWQDHEHKAFTEWLNKNPCFSALAVGLVTGGNQEQKAFSINRMT
jgi:hypothetical protein